ncbi:MAG: VOC family protein [Acidimicrobiales bacterium]|nr:VOC family protein [Acidimicrobiales bacterium]
MNATEQFHVGVVVDDLDAALDDLGDLFGYHWCPALAVQTPVVLPSGDLLLDLRFTYSATTPRVEVIQSVPGTLWVPAAGSGVHHVGYWSNDVEADGRRLVARGYAEEARGVHPDGTAAWTYHRSVNGPRVELVSRSIQAGLEQYWASAPAAPG